MHYITQGNMGYEYYLKQPVSINPYDFHTCLCLTRADLKESFNALLFPLKKHCISKVNQENEKIR